MRKLILIATLLLATSATASDRVLFYYNGDGFHTKLVLVNPANANKTVPDFWAPIPPPQLGGGTVAYGRPVALAPFETFKFPEWPVSGGGLATVNVPEPVLAYTEITDSGASKLQFPEIPTITETSQLQDLEPSTYVIVLGDAWVDFFNGSRPVAVGGGVSEPHFGASVILVPAQANRAVVTPYVIGGGSAQPPPLRAFAVKFGPYGLESFTPATSVQ